MRDCNIIFDEYPLKEENNVFDLSSESFILLWVRRPSCVNILFSRTTGPILTIFYLAFVCGKEMWNCKFYNPSAEGKSYGGKKCKIDVFFKNRLSNSSAWFRQTIYRKVYHNDDHGRVYHNCKFHDPRGRVSCAKVWPYKS